MVAPPKLWNEPAALTAGAGVRDSKRTFGFAERRSMRSELSSECKLMLGLSTLAAC